MVLLHLETLHEFINIITYLIVDPLSSSPGQKLKVSPTYFTVKASFTKRRGVVPVDYLVAITILVLIITFSITASANLFLSVQTRTAAEYTELSLMEITRTLLGSAGSPQDWAHLWAVGPQQLGLATQPITHGAYVLDPDKIERLNPESRSYLPWSSGDPYYHPFIRANDIGWFYTLDPSVYNAHATLGMPDYSLFQIRLMPPFKVEFLRCERLHHGILVMIRTLSWDGVPIPARYVITASPLGIGRVLTASGQTDPDTGIAVEYLSPVTGYPYVIVCRAETSDGRSSYNYNFIQALISPTIQTLVTCTRGESPYINYLNVTFYAWDITTDPPTLINSTYAEDKAVYFTVIIQRSGSRVTVVHINNTSIFPTIDSKSGAFVGFDQSSNAWRALVPFNFRGLATVAVVTQQDPVVAATTRGICLSCPTPIDLSNYLYAMLIGADYTNSMWINPEWGGLGTEWLNGEPCNETYAGRWNGEDYQWAYYIGTNRQFQGVGVITPPGAYTTGLMAMNLAWAWSIFGDITYYSQYWQTAIDRNWARPGTTPYIRTLWLYRNATTSGPKLAYIDSTTVAGRPFSWNYRVMEVGISDILKERYGYDPTYGDVWSHPPPDVGGAYEVANCSLGVITLNFLYQYEVNSSRVDYYRCGLSNASWLIMHRQQPVIWPPDGSPNQYEGGWMPDSPRSALVAEFDDVLPYAGWALIGVAHAYVLSENPEYLYNVSAAGSPTIRFHGACWAADFYICLLYTSPSPRDRG